MPAAQLIRATLALAALLAAQAGHAQSPSPQLVQAALRDVAQVIANGCAGSGARTGTAFVWPDSTRMVTARHVVAGCSNVRVQFPGGPSFTARPERELASHDLVLLRLSAASGRQPVRIGDAIPPIHSQVAAVGYALGAPTPDDKLLTITAANAPPGAKLRDMLPLSFQQQLQASGALSLATEILRLDGNLLSGHSGAPLIAHDGRVVAIGSGGLQNGAGGLVWAVRTRYLVSLQQQPQITAVAALARPTGLVFADQAPQANVRQQTCGSFTLSLARTVPLSVLSQDSDDQRGLQQLLGTIGASLDEAGGDRFDVWVDRESGAAIPLPAGTQLQNGPVGCIAILSPTVGFNIVAVRADDSSGLPASAQIQNASVTFEQVLASSFPGLMPDPAFTYAAPVTRPDGFLANRKGAARNFPVAPGMFQADYVFLTHITRGNTYVGVSAIRNNMQLDTQMAMACAPNPRAPQCAPFRAAFRDWALAAAAVHLATIPPI